MTESDGIMREVAGNIAELEARLDELEQLRDRVADLEEEVHRLDERTDMLRMVETADSLSAHERSTALFQHAVRKIQASGRLTSLSLTRDDAEDALHHPDVDRTTIYTDMERVERLVGDHEIVEYVPAGESQTGDAKLVVSLESVDPTVDASTLVEGVA